MASYNYTFTSGDTVTPTKLNSARTVSEIVNADVSATAAIAGTKVAPAFGGQDITLSTANRSITNTGNFALSFGTNNAERMRIDASGNVGIGTTSPSAKVDINGASTAFGAPETSLALIGNAGVANSSVVFASGNTNFRYQNLFYVDSGALVWQNSTNGSSFTERMRIDASGNVGIGTTPNARLTVATANPSNGINAVITNSSASGHTGSQIQITQNTIQDWVVGQPAGVDAFAIWSGRNAVSAGNERLRIDASGNVGIGTSSPASTSGRNITIGGIEPSIVLDSSSGARSFSISSGGNFLYAPSALVFYDNTAAATRMLIDASGNVGIGTATPAYKLDVVGGILAGGNGTIVGGISYSSNRSEIGAVSNHSLGLITANVTRVVIDTSGNVGINDAAPAYHLDVNGDANVTGVWRVDDTQVVTNRRTGWAAPTGTATRTAFATSTVTTAQLAERVKALIDDLTTHGLIGA
jgi:hypothetical protein